MGWTQNQQRKDKSDKDQFKEPRKDHNQWTGY